MANSKNLKGYGFDERTPSEQRKIAQQGGRASGKARRRKKTLREIAEMLSSEKIDMPQPDGSKKHVAYDVAMIQRQFQKAITEGDTNAAKYITNLLGEEMLAQQTTNIYNVSSETAKNMRELEDSDI